MSSYRACPSCACYVRRDDRACPFCGAAVPSAHQQPASPARPRSSRAVWLACGAAFASVGCTESHGAPGDAAVDTTYHDDTAGDGERAEASAGTPSSRHRSTGSPIALASTRPKGRPARTQMARPPLPRPGSPASRRASRATQRSCATPGRSTAACTRATSRRRAPAPSSIPRVSRILPWPMRARARTLRRRPARAAFGARASRSTLTAPVPICVGRAPTTTQAGSYSRAAPATALPRPTFVVDHATTLDDDGAR
jgi:hypothetical protein